jgi:hypothetical protein
MVQFIMAPIWADDFPFGAQRSRQSRSGDVGDEGRLDESRSAPTADRTPSTVRLTALNCAVVSSTKTLTASRDSFLY